MKQTLGLFALMLLPLMAARADNGVEAIEIVSQLDLNSVLITGVDVVFFYDDSIVSDGTFTQNDWYSNKRQYRETYAEVIDLVQIPVLQGFYGSRVALPERHAEALRVLVFAEHQNPQSPALDITGLQDVLVTIDPFGIVVSERP